MAYNPLNNEDIRDCFFDYEQAVLLRFWLPRVVRTRSAADQQANLGLVFEEKVTILVTKSDIRKEFGLGFSDELLKTSLMVVWESIKTSWCPIPNADSILRATQDVQRELNSDCILRDLNIKFNLMTTASAVACAKRRDTLCFIRFRLERISVPALNTCVKMLREGDERAKA